MYVIHDYVEAKGLDGACNLIAAAPPRCWHNTVPGDDIRYVSVTWCDAPCALHRHPIIAVSHDHAFPPKRANLHGEMLLLEAQSLARHRRAMCCTRRRCAAMSC